MKKKYIIAAFIFSILIIAGWWYFGSARMNRMYRDDLKISCDVKNIIFSPYGIDICNLISLFERSNPYDAFDMNRESLLDEIYPSNNRLVYPTKKHNSLYDARVIKSIYEAYMTSC